MASRSSVPGDFPSDDASPRNEQGEAPDVAIEDRDHEDEDEDDDYEDNVDVHHDDDDDDVDDDDDGDEAGYEVQLEIEDDIGDDIQNPAQRTRYLLQLLAANPNIRNMIRFTDDIEGNEFTLWPRRRRRSPPDPGRFPKVPSIAGEELMASGNFGSNDVQNADNDNRIRRRKRLARRILDREIASGDFASQGVNRRMMAQEMLPSSNADIIINYEEPVYSGQFSDDGNFFFAVTKDFKVRMYDTSNPYKWRYYKTVFYPYGQWTLTDASLSPDNKYLAYTSIRSTVCLAPTDPNDMGEPYNLELADYANVRTNPGVERRGAFGIWSIRFSGDGRELVAGTTGGSIVVYDIESRRPIHRIFGHEDDVNAVCFADKSSPHILYSGSDDATIKVWDTRSMSGNREVGVFVGHIEGLTYLDSKGDGRYVLSNGKDQNMKLWDLRMVMSSAQFSSMRATRRRPQSNFDYRFGEYDEDDWYRDENDNSLVTFRGHKVLRTLIRCHFSPPGSTNSRYVYSGSADGKVYIWNLDATLAGVVDVFQATENTRVADDEGVHRGWHGGWHDNLDERRWRWKTVVRDASWHPTAPMIAASAWNGYGNEYGTVTTHSWNDGAEDDEAEPEMGSGVNYKLECNPRRYRTRAAMAERRQRA